MKEVCGKNSESQSKIRCATPVTEFYKGRTVFVTGSTGFLGTVLIEKLLHTCDDIKRVYVLIKEKDGQNTEERLLKFIKSRAFHRLREHNPSFMSKIKPIGGNISEPNLGLDERDISFLRNEVSVVFHLAASTSFNMGMADAISSNTKSTGELLRVCKGIRKLTAFVYVSTAYSNCNKFVIDERVYKTKVPVEQVFELIKHSKQEDTLKLLLDGRPNTYSYSKALTEELVQMHSNEIPSVIIRPSIILSASRDPEPGWLNGWNGLDQFIYGGITGQIKCWHADPSMVQDTIPVDYAANLTIVSAWDLHERRSKGDKTLKVFNCCSSNTNPISTGKRMSLCIDFYAEDTNNTRKVGTWFPLIKNPLLYYFVMIFLHFVPAMAIDFCNWLRGRRVKLTKEVKKLMRCTDFCKFFSLNQFLFVDINVRNLLEVMDENDKMIYDFDVRNINWEIFLKDYVIGMKKFILDKKQ